MASWLTDRRALSQKIDFWLTDGHALTSRTGVLHPVGPAASNTCSQRNAWGYCCRSLGPHAPPDSGGHRGQARHLPPTAQATSAAGDLFLPLARAGAPGGGRWRTPHPQRDHRASVCGGVARPGPVRGLRGPRCEGICDVWRSRCCSGGGGAPPPPLPTAWGWKGR